MNRRSHGRFEEEKQALQGLPEQQTANYQTLNLKVTRSSTIGVRRVVYSVPSRLIGERVQVRLYHDKLMIYVGQQIPLKLARIYPCSGNSRAKSIDYKHLIHAFAGKPQAFRYLQLRDELLPDDNYRQLWQYADKALESREACKWIMTVLRLAYEYDAEKQLGEELLVEVKSGKFASIKAIQDRFFLPSQSMPEMQGKQHDLQSYDALLSSLKEQKSWTPEAPF